jgi:hypothetical protein
MSRIVKPSGLIAREAAAEILGVDVRTLGNWCDSGEMPKSQSIGARC